MANLFYSLALFLLTNIYIYGQNAAYKVIYEFSYALDTVKFQKYTKNENHLLYHIDGNSRYLALNSYFNDSVYIASDLSKLEEKLNPEDFATLYSQSNFFKNRKRFIFDFKVVKDFSKTKFSIFYHSDNGIIKYEDQLKIDWKILNEVDSFEGIKIIKAMCSHGGREYEAWFAPDIPIYDGPYIFSGLPGLIIKVKDIDARFIWNLTTYSVKPQKVVHNDDYWPPRFLTTSRSQFLDICKSVVNGRNTLSGDINFSNEDLIRIKSNNSKRLYLLIEK